MSSRISTSTSASKARTSAAMRRRGGLPSMSEKQTEAYLIARDTLRRIQRISSLVPPPGGGTPGPGYRS